MQLTNVVKKECLGPLSSSCQAEMKSTLYGPTDPGLPPPSEWRYRIEGGQKVIFYRSTRPGTAGVGHVPKVLCIDLSPRLYPHSRHKQREKPAHQALFRRYMGRYLLLSIPIRLSEPYLVQLAAEAEALRPPARRRNNSFSSASLDAELFPDLALQFGRETALVELKPKSGILSRSALVHPKITDSLQKFRVPPYYYKNYLFPEGTDEVGRLPDVEHRYDPMKMLSGMDIGPQLRILHAERARGLRLFDRGTRLEHVSALHECNDGFCRTALNVAAKALSDISSTGECCLRSLRSVQRHDYIDNIGAGLLLQSLMEQVGKSRAYEMIEEYVYQDDTDLLHMEDEEEYHVSKRIVSYESTEEAIRLHSQERYVRATEEVMRMKPNVCARMLAEFMQAAAAKDCSFMVSMCPEEKATYKHHGQGPPDKPFGLVQHDGRSWLYCVHVIDVGAKSIDKIVHKWPAMDFEKKNRLSSVGGLDKLL